MVGGYDRLICMKSSRSKWQNFYAKSDKNNKKYMFFHLIKSTQNVFQKIITTQYKSALIKFNC